MSLLRSWFDMSCRKIFGKDGAGSDIWQLVVAILVTVVNARLIRSNLILSARSYVAESFFRRVAQFDKSRTSDFD